MRISEEIRQRVIELDRRYRSTWDVRSIAHVIGIGHNSVAKIVREARGPRPKRKKHPHDGRTRFLYRDVMWSSDFMDLHDGRKLLKTMDEMSLHRLGWDITEAETAYTVVEHAEALIRCVGRAPLIWKYDHGSQFTSDKFQEFLARHKILAYPIPPRSPWVNGRTERDNHEVRNWLIEAEAKKLTGAELERDIDEGMLMLNHIKPRAVLGYKRSAEVYLAGTGIEGWKEEDRGHFCMNVEDLKCQLGRSETEKTQRKAIRLALQNWELYEEWNERTEDARIVNRSRQKNISD